MLITGHKGVGKTATVRDLARRTAAGDFPHLINRRFLWLDVSNVGPEDSRACLETIAAVASSTPSEPIEFRVDGTDTLNRVMQDAFERAIQEDAAPDIILCLDGINALLERPNGGTNKPLLRAIASRPGVQIIGILDRWAFNDLIAGDAKMLELFTRIDIEEPNEETALEILRQKAAGFEREYELSIGDDVIRKTISLASNYVLNECHPAKGINILRQACDDVDYDATQRTDTERAATEGGPYRSKTVTVDDVVRVVSEKTGIPAATLQGDAGEADFERALAEAVVGQERAVQAAATEQLR